MQRVPLYSRRSNAHRPGSAPQPQPAQTVCLEVMRTPQGGWIRGINGLLLPHLGLYKTLAPSHHPGIKIRKHRTSNIQASCLKNPPRFGGVGKTSTVVIGPSCLKPSFRLKTHELMTARLHSSLSGAAAFLRMLTNKIGGKRFWKHALITHAYAVVRMQNVLCLTRT